MSLLPFGLERENRGREKKNSCIHRRNAFENRRVKFGGGRWTLWLANEKKPWLILLVLREETRFNVISGRGHRAFYLDFTSHRGTFRSNRELFETVLRKERGVIRFFPPLSLSSSFFYPLFPSYFHGKIFISPVKRNSTTGSVR